MHWYKTNAMNNTPKKGDTMPITKKEDVAKSKDHRIDDDFNNYPHAPASEEIIKKQRKNGQYKSDKKASTDELPYQ